MTRARARSHDSDGRVCTSVAVVVRVSVVASAVAICIRLLVGIIWKVIDAGLVVPCFAGIVCGFVCVKIIWIWCSVVVRIVGEWIILLVADVIVVGI